MHDVWTLCIIGRGIAVVATLGSAIPSFVICRVTSYGLSGGLDSLCARSCAITENFRNLRWSWRHPGNELMGFRRERVSWRRRFLLGGKISVSEVQATTKKKCMPESVIVTDW